MGISEFSSLPIIGQNAQNSNTINGTTSPIKPTATNSSTEANAKNIAEKTNTNAEKPASSPCNPSFYQAILGIESKTTELTEIEKLLLQQIKKYNEQIRQEPTGELLLMRNPLYECNILYQEKNFYRMIGDLGYEDFINTGLIRAKQNTKQNYDMAYFEQGRANNIYARRNGASYIVETDSDKIQTGTDCYPHVDKLTKDDSIRIWKRTNDREYEIVYDTINDIISKYWKIKD